MRFIALLPIFFILVGCAEEEYDPESSFTKIYDSQNASLSFDPIDIAETSEGFIVLTNQSSESSDFAGVNIIKLDKEGNYVSEEDLSANYVIPVGKMISVDSAVYFMAMEPVSLRAVLIKATYSASSEVTPLSASLSFPLAMNKTADDDIIFLSYNSESLQTILSIIELDGTVTQSNGYSIGAGSDVEAEIIAHYVDPERSSLPFFCGEVTTDQYYFNGFYNYNLSLVFTALGDNPTGVVQGQGTNGGISKLLPIQSNQFALFGFQFNDNFIDALGEINTSALSSSIDYFSDPISEFISRTTVDMTLWNQDDNTMYTIIAAETEGRQVALYFYESATGILLAIHKLGYINPYTLSSIKMDSENNLLVLGTTYVAGRFERIYLSKIPNSELRSILK